MFLNFVILRLCMKPDNVILNNYLETLSFCTIQGPFLSTKDIVVGYLPDKMIQTRV